MTGGERRIVAPYMDGLRTSHVLTLPKMASDANAFEISDIEEVETEASLSRLINAGSLHDLFKRLVHKLDSANMSQQIGDLQKSKPASKTSVGLAQPGLKM